MADVSYFYHSDTIDDYAPSYWSHHLDFDLYASDPEFPSSDPSLPIAAIHDDDADIDDHLFSHPELSFDVVIDDGDGDDVDTVLNIATAEIIEDHHHSDVDFDADGNFLPDSANFGFVDRNCDFDEELELELELGLGLGLERDFENEGEDDFFLAKSVSGIDSCVDSVLGSSVRIADFGSDSEEEDRDRGLIGIDSHPEEDGFGLDDDLHSHDYGANIPLRWDSLRLSDRREFAEDFEWEEIDARVDEREILTALSIDPEIENEGESVSVAVSQFVPREEEEAMGSESEERMGNLEWQILLDATTGFGTSSENDPFQREHDYVFPAEYDMLIGQFADAEAAATAAATERPPAARAVVENLPAVVITKEDVTNGHAQCAVCKDEIGVGEGAKRLPCLHLYHGDCIVPWLWIRNTCPVCRHELPTDDAAYEQSRRSLRSVRDGSGFGNY